MKITNKKCNGPRQTLLGEVRPGTVVRFDKRFSDKHGPKDIFIVNSVCNSYVPEIVKRGVNYPHEYDRHISTREQGYASSGCISSGYDGFEEVALTNLRTGSLIYVLGQKTCLLIKAEVCYTEDFI